MTDRIETIGYKNPECCKCPQMQISRGTGFVETCAYNLSNGHLVWAYEDTRHSVLGAQHAFTPQYDGSFNSLDRIFPSGARNVVTASASLIEEVMVAGQAADGTYGTIGYDGTALVYSSDLTATTPAFTTEATNTSPYYSKLAMPMQKDVDCFFGDTMYAIRDDGSAFDVEIERVADGTTMTAYINAAGGGSFNVPPGSTTGRFVIDSFNGVFGGIFTGIFGDASGSWTNLASGGGGVDAKLTLGNYVWYTNSGDKRVAHIDDFNNYVDVQKDGNVTQMRILGDKVALIWVDNVTDPADDKITLAVYEEDGTEIWAKVLSNRVTSGIIDTVGAGGSGDIILRSRRISGTGSGYLLRRYDITDGTLKWATRADDMPTGGAFQVVGAIGLAISTVEFAGSNDAVITSVNTTVDTYAESIPGA